MQSIQATTVQSSHSAKQSRNSARLALQQWAKNHHTTVEVTTAPHSLLPHFSETTIRCGLLKQVVKTMHQPLRTQEQCEESAAVQFLSRYGSMPIDFGRGK
jgi:hypothetical protein